MKITDYLPLPIFGDGAALSASDMNRLSIVQEYIAQSNMVVYATYQIEQDDARTLYHKYDNFLWWTYTILNNVRLVINNITIENISGQSGSIALDTNGLNPYGLEFGKTYEAYWRDGPVEGIYFMEAPDPGGYPFTYPNPIHTFTAGNQLASAQLNDIVANMDYIMQQHAAHVVPGFMYRKQELYPYGTQIERWEQHFWIRNLARYLHVMVRHNNDGYDSTGLRHFTVRVNSQSIYDSSFPGSRGSVDYSLIIDMEGTDHQVVSGDDPTITSPPAIPYGDWYKVTLYSDCPMYATDNVEYFLVAAMPGHMPVPGGGWV